MLLNNYVEIVIVNCQIQLFLDNMVLANQNAKLTGPELMTSYLSIVVSERRNSH